jgi:hypothetical protein
MDLRKENSPRGDDGPTFWEKAKLILSKRQKSEGRRPQKLGMWKYGTGRRSERVTETDSKSAQRK